MRRAAAILVGVVSLAISAPALTQEYQEPPRRWFSTVAQGTVTAAVRNNSGAELRFWCPTDASFENVQPAVQLSVLGTAGEALESINAVLEIDGKPFEWSFDRSTGADGNITYGSRAFNLQTEAYQAELVSKLRQGHRLIVYIPTDRVMQEFTLAGSSEALSGCVRG